MPVLLFDSTADPIQGVKFHAPWATQWQQADPNNRVAVPIDGVGSHNKIRDVIVDAVRLAGRTAFNELILAVGHGGGVGEAGLIDLAPKRAMRLVKGTIGSRSANGVETFYDPFYDFTFFHATLKPKSDKTQDEEWIRQGDRTNVAGARFRLGRHAIYQSIGTAIQGSNVNQVVFMTCNVGNAVDFVKKVAFDWKVKIRAYQKFIKFQLNVGGKGRARAFFEGDQVGSGSNTVAAETDLPQTNFITVGPPLTALPVTQPRALPVPSKKADLSPWIGIDGQVIDPRAPGNPSGHGNFRTAGVLFTEQSYEGLPHPLSLAARAFDPLNAPRFA